MQWGKWKQTHAINVLHYRKTQRPIFNHSASGPLQQANQLIVEYRHDLRAECLRLSL